MLDPFTYISLANRKYTGKSVIIPTICIVCKRNENERVEIIFNNAIECLGNSCPETLLDKATLRELENAAELLSGGE